MISGAFFRVELGWAGRSFGSFPREPGLGRTEKLRTTRDTIVFVSPRVSCTGHDLKKPGNIKTRTSSRELFPQGI